MGAVIEKIIFSGVYQILSAEDEKCRGWEFCYKHHDQIRIYEKPKVGMEWRVDDIIYQNTKQIEVVLTRIVVLCGDRMINPSCLLL